MVRTRRAIEAHGIMTSRRDRAVPACAVLTPKPTAAPAGRGALPAARIRGGLCALRAEGG